MEICHFTRHMCSLLVPKRCLISKAQAPTSQLHRITISLCIRLISSFPDLVVLSSSLHLPKGKVTISITGHLKGKIVSVNQRASPIKEKQGSSFSEFGDLTENLLFTCHHSVCWHPEKNLGRKGNSEMMLVR